MGKITLIIIATLVIAAISYGTTLFAGGVFTAFNTTQDTAFADRFSNYNSTIEASQDAYQALQKQTTSTSPFIVGYVLAGWNGLKALMNGLATALNFPIAAESSVTEAGYGFQGFSTFISIAVGIAITTIIGYLIYLFLGKGGGGVGV